MVITNEKAREGYWYTIPGKITDLVSDIMAQKHLSPLASLDIVYKSSTYANLENETTKYWWMGKVALFEDFTENTQGFESPMEDLPQALNGNEREAIFFTAWVFEFYIRDKKQSWKNADRIFRERDAREWLFYGWESLHSENLEWLSDNIDKLPKRN